MTTLWLSTMVSRFTDEETEVTLSKVWQLVDGETVFKPRESGSRARVFNS